MVHLERRSEIEPMGGVECLQETLPLDARLDGGRDERTPATCASQRVYLTQQLDEDGHVGARQRPRLWHDPHRREFVLDGRTDVARLRIGAPVGPLLLGLAAAQALGGVLFFIRVPIVVGLWPMPGTGEMTFILLASFFGASAASTTWAVRWGEPGSLVGIALDYVVIFGPLTVLAVVLDPARGGGSGAFIVATLAGALVGVVMLWWSWRYPLLDPHPTPRLVRGAFWVFLVALLFAGGTLIARVPNIMPWALTPELSVVTGMMFLGSASYFAYGLVRPRWSNAGGQLAGFLAYDLVLIVPLVTRAGTVYSGWGINLWAYTVVIVGSGLLAGWYLLLEPHTRMFRARPSETDTDPGA